MTSKIGRGDTITLTAQFLDGTGAAVDGGTVLVDIIDPSDVEQVTDASPTSNPSTGYYTYDHAVGIADDLGVWTAHWTGTVNGVPVSGDGFFEVVAAGTVVAGGGADPLDLLTLIEGYRAINTPVGTATVIAGNPGPHDDELAAAITAISRRIDELCGPVVKRTYTGRTYDGGRHAIELADLGPLETVVVTEYDGTDATVLTAETNAVKPDDAYLLDGRGGRTLLRRRSGNADAVFPAGRRNVVVDHVVGRYDDTGSVDRQFKVAAAEVLRRTWRREQGAWGNPNDPFDTDAGPAFFDAYTAAINELLDDQLRPGAVA